MTQATRPDLVISDILAEKPTRTFTINVSDVQPGRLSLIEALDIVEASGISSTNFERTLSRGSLAQKAKLIYAFAWVVARRVEPDLTYAEVCTYQISVKGEPVNDEADKRKAEAVVSVASLANVSPEEAKKMNMAEVAAVVELRKKAIPPIRRSKPLRRRRAS